MSVGNSAPLACEKLFRPLAQLDQLNGSWFLVAGSLNDSADAKILKQQDSVTFHFYNSMLTQVNLVGPLCEHHPFNISIEGNVLKMQTKSSNFTATFVSTSCPDCLVFGLDLVTPNDKVADFYLLSKRRTVTQTEMEEYMAQVECLKMPPPVLMDPTKQICSYQTTIKKAAFVEEKTD